MEASELKEEVERLEALIKYWQGYPCKFHCRTAKENFYAGYKANSSGGFYEEEVESAWQRFKTPSGQSER